jgi:hypothetical protein
MEPWRSGGRGRRRAVFGLALAAHLGLVVLMLHARARRERPDDAHAVLATIVLRSPRRAPTAAATPVPPRVTRLRALPREVVEPGTIAAPAVEARAASTPAPVASAASEPLRLTLTRGQLRAVIAGSRPTLAQSLARYPAPSALASLGGDVPDEEIPRPGGVTEVHVHGGCFRLVPTPRAQYDPFNHGNERLTADCAR